MKHLLMKKIMTIVIILLSQFTFAADYYVSPSGSDANSGSFSSPWQTLRRVQTLLNTTVQPGDRIFFQKGQVWTGTLNVRTIWGGTGKSGTVANPIYIGAYGNGAKPRITGATNIANFHFAGVSNYVIEGLNFEDTNFDPSNKIGQAPTKSGIQVGQFKEAVGSNIVIRDCSFSNIALGVILVGDYNTVIDCTFTNMKNWKSTLGTDANGDGIVQQTEPGADDDYGANPVTITGNFNKVTGCWIEGAWSESWDYGWDGGAIEFFNTCNNNEITYNTIFDCEGVAEFGGYAADNAVCNNNLFAYNKIINCGSLTWINVTGGFVIQPNNVQYYNNTIIETSTCRFAGANLGAGAVTPAVLSKILLVGQSNLLGFNGTPTASVVFNIRNNFFYIENGQRICRSATVFQKSVFQNNVYRLVNGSLQYQTLHGSELLTTASITQIITSNSGSVQNWNYYPISNSPLIERGQRISGFTVDFAGTPISGNPEVGALESIVVPACTFTYGAWSSCSNGKEIRSYTSSPVGCSGTPPADSISRDCQATCSIVYYAWSSCLNGIQIRDYTATPDGCITPPVDSIQRACLFVKTFSPTVASKGTTITIRGTNFSSLIEVRLANVQKDFTFVNDSTVTIVGDTTGAITLVTPSGSVTTSQVFTVSFAPVITSFTPTTGGRGTQVTIDGKNLGNLIAWKPIKFGRYPAASYTVVNADRVIATVGYSDRGKRVKISVTTTAGTATSTTRFTFR